MIRKLRTQRDNQQWMLDLALNMRGRVQNFERDDLEVPAGKRARNYRMLPKVWREAPGGPEGVARGRGAARGACQARPGDGSQRVRDLPLRPCHRGLSHGAASDLLRRSSGEDRLESQVVRDGGPAFEGRELSDRARRSAVWKRQDHLL